MKCGSKLKSRGQTLVEMTLLLPIILIFVGGLTDVGLAFFVGTSMENAVREGARLAASGMPLNQIQAEVRKRIAAPGMFTGGAAGIVLTPNPPVVTNLTIPSGCVSPTPQQQVTVTATGTYNYMFLRLVGITSVPMSRSETMHFEGPDLCN